MAVEDIHVRLEGYLGPVLLRLAYGLDRFRGLAALVLLVPYLALAVDLHLQSRGQRVDHRDADAVQSARDLVGLPVELAAGMQDGHDHFQRRLALELRVLDVPHGVHRDAGAVVEDADDVAGMDDDLDRLAASGQYLVDGVVDHLVDQVVESRRSRRTDVHRGPLAHRLQSFQDLDLRRIVGVLGRNVLGTGLGGARHVLFSLGRLRRGRPALRTFASPRLLP